MSSRQSIKTHGATSMNLWEFPPPQCQIFGIATFVYTNCNMFYITVHRYYHSLLDVACVCCHCHAYDATCQIISRVAITV